MPESTIPAPSPAPDEEGPDQQHDWVVAATLPVTVKIAKHANLRLRFYTEAGMLVNALEVYCSGCRRPLDDVELTPCAAKVNNTHLIGGDQAVRAKRKPFVLPAGAERLPGQQFTRRGVAAYVDGGASILTGGQ